MCLCAAAVWLHHGTLTYYGGNYANFVTTVAEEERLQLKVYEKQHADMEKLSDFVRVNKANGVAASAKSKKKVGSSAMERHPSPPMGPHSQPAL